MQSTVTVLVFLVKKLQQKVINVLLTTFVCHIYIIFFFFAFSVKLSLESVTTSYPCLQILWFHSQPTWK